MTTPTNSRDALVKRLQEAATVLRNNPCEVYGMQQLCEEVITLLTAPAEAEREPWPNHNWCKGCHPGNCVGCGTEHSERRKAAPLPQSAPVSREAVIEGCANTCERMVIGGRAWTHDQQISAEALFAAAKAIRALAAHPAEPGKEK